MFLHRIAGPSLRRGVSSTAHGVSRTICPRRIPGSRAHALTPNSAPRRGIQSSGPFEPLQPPSPASLGAPRQAKTYPGAARWLRRLVILSALSGTIYVADRHIYGSGLVRSVRTFSTGLLVALDYKINFRPRPIVGGTIQDLHVRSAERLFGLLHVNGGLYLKMGQAIAMQSAMLPPEFQRMFARMFDDAPQDEWRDAEAVIREDFLGMSVEDVFGVSFRGEEGKGVMERRARASASVAQVHWARLPDGEEVAVKIQKREIAKQISWDLWAFSYVRPLLPDGQATACTMDC
jgi:aarF domain-containing kinase